MTDNDSERIRDLEKSVDAVHARISKGNEYILRDIRLSTEDIRDAMNIFDKRIVKVETDVSWIKKDGGGYYFSGFSNR